MATARAARPRRGTPRTRGVPRTRPAENPSCTRLHWRVSEHPVLILSTGPTEVHEEFEHRPLVHVEHPARGLDGVPFHEGRDDPGAAGRAQSVHNPGMLERTRTVK